MRKLGFHAWFGAFALVIEGSCIVDFCGRSAAKPTSSTSILNDFNRTAWRVLPTNSAVAP